MITRTKNGLPKHCAGIIDRHGRRRVRFRQRGFSTYFTGIPWSDDFMRQYAAALEGVKAQAGNVSAERTNPARSTRCASRIFARLTSAACGRAHSRRVAISLSRFDWRMATSRSIGAVMARTSFC
jgi:hypothetical protein